MKLIAGTRFIHDSNTYEVKDVAGGLVKASLVDPKTGKASRGRPNHFKISDISDVSFIEQEEKTVSRVENFATPSASLYKEPSPEDIEKVKNLISSLKLESPAEPW